jgi:hypothetical protein
MARMTAERIAFPCIRVSPMPPLPVPIIDAEELLKNTNEQYAALGRFVEAFELMVNEVREICIERVCNAS